MLRDTGHEMVVETLNMVDIHTVDHVCTKMGVELTIEDGEVSDYNFKEENV